MNRLIPEQRGRYWGYRNQNGELIVPHRYNYAKEFIHGLGVVESADNYNEGVINTKGDIIVPFEFSYININESTIIVGKSFSYGIFNHEGDEIIPLKYGNLIRIREGYYKDCYWAEFSNEKFGIISKYDEVLVSPKVDEIRFNSSGNISTLWRKFDEYSERELNDLGITLN